jgi:hypothetical protein
VKLRGFSWLPEGPDELLEERFYLRVPAGQAINHATDNRYYSLSMNIAPNTGLNLTGFWGCTVRVEEFMYGVSGRSINLFGLRADTIPKMDFDTQLKCDSYAHELVESYHAPTVYISANLKPGYIDTSDIVGGRPSGWKTSSQGRRWTSCAPGRCSGSVEKRGMSR